MTHLHSRLIRSLLIARLAGLVSFGTRETLSNQDGTTRAIGGARQWIFDEMKRSQRVDR